MKISNYLPTFLNSSTPLGGKVQLVIGIETIRRLFHYIVTSPAAPVQLKCTALVASLFIVDGQWDQISKELNSYRLLPTNAKILCVVLPILSVGFLAGVGIIGMGLNTPFAYAYLQLLDLFLIRHINAHIAINQSLREGNDFDVYNVN